MKITTPIFATLVATALAIGSLAAEQKANGHATAEARAEAHAEANGNQTSTHRKTVTVTSDGKRTIKKTVEVRNGVETVTTEITDENGKVTTTTTEPGGDEKPVAEDPDTPWLGVRLSKAPEVLRNQLSLPEGQGAVIDVVAPDGPADKAGIVKGDLLLTFDKKPIAGPDDLSAELQRREVGETVELEIMQRGETKTLNATLEKRPADHASEPPPTPDYLLEDGPGNGGKAEVEIDGGGPGVGFDSILKNPQLPADFKDTVREMQQKMREFERRHGAK
jgi:C-terminal processing protease CtpA/Prc